MDFKKYINFDTTGDFSNFQSIETRISELEKQNKLLGSSVIFLTKKIEEFKSNGKLEDYEINFIKKQINFHKKLSTLKNEYIQNKGILSEKSESKINLLYNKIEGTTIGESEINYLKGNMKSEQLKITDTPLSTSYRDFIEKNINIKWMLEAFYETDEIKLFYDLFTKYYLLLSTEKKTTSIGSGFFKTQEVVNLI